MCQNSTDSQKPLSGACAKVQGQGTAQLQLSNQSPTICQLGMSPIRTLRSDAMAQTILSFAGTVLGGMRLAGRAVIDATGGLWKKSQVRTGLAAGGRWIRTSGSGE